MHEDRQAFKGRVDELVRRGDIDAAIAQYTAHLERDPDDDSAGLAVAELCLQGGYDDEAVAQFTRVADRNHDEGFFSKAAALYRKVLRVREDDHALLSLTDIAARQGRLLEARQCLLQLERCRRDRGDIEGADECLASLEALLAVKNSPEPLVLDASPVALPADIPGDVAVEDAGGNTAIVAVTDVLEHAVASEASVGDRPPAAIDTPAPDASEPRPPAAGVPASRPTRRPGLRGRRLPVAGGARKKVKPLQSVFNEMRAQAREADDVAAAHERFDLAQYHLRDGDEAAAMIELQEAARTPVLRFAASAQLGRLSIGRGELASGVEWLERAAAAPPVSPDEGLAVLYELADALQRLDEPARALAVFMELNAQRRGYRDVQVRIAALSASPQGGSQDT